MLVCDLCQQTNESGELNVFRTVDGQTLCEDCADIEKEVTLLLEKMPWPDGVLLKEWEV